MEHQDVANLLRSAEKVVSRAACKLRFSDGSRRADALIITHGAEAA